MLDTGASVLTRLTGIALDEAAVQVIDGVLASGAPTVCLFSAGKDSSCVANLLLTAAARRARRGDSVPPLLIARSSTGVENPEIEALATGEIEKMRRFATANGFELTTRVARPSLYSSFPVRVLSGRALPSFADTSRDCSIELKLRPSRRMRKQVFAELKAVGDPVLLVGTRADESQARAINTAARGERSDQIWIGPDGERMLSPILAWSTDDVWTYLSQCSSGVCASYSDFTETMRIYRDSGGTSCYVVSDMVTESAKLAKGGCGSRTGCFVCVRVKEDKSLNNMVESEPRYHYMQPLALSPRFHCGHAVRLEPANLDPAHDRREGCDPHRPGCLLPSHAGGVAALLPVGASRRAGGGAAPWHRAAVFNREPPRAGGDRRDVVALRTAQAVSRAGHRARDRREGARFTPPIVKPFAKTPLPPGGRLHVGNDWDDQLGEWAATGLRDPLAELHGEQCDVTTRYLKDGRVVLDVDEAPRFDVDEEGAALFMMFEADRYIREYHRDDADWTMGYRIYIRYGFLRPARGHSGEADRLLRRTQWKQRHGLVGDVDPEVLLARCHWRAKAADVDEQQTSLFI